MNAWLTPDTGVIAPVSYAVFLPDDDQLRACFYGAFLLLCQERNWQQFGTMTPAEAAALFEQCWLLTHPPGANIAECP